MNLNNLLLDIKNSSVIDKVIAILVFAMPILSLSVRHWLSGSFSIIVLISVLFLWKDRTALHKEEKLLLLIFLIYLMSFLLSATLNDWSINSYKRLGTEFKYMMFFPLYMMLRKTDYLPKILLYGVILGGMGLGIQALIDFFVLGKGGGRGIYGPIVFGDLSVLFLAFAAIAILSQPSRKLFYFLAILSIILSGIAVYLSGSRNAWIAFSVMLFVLPLLATHKDKIKRILTIYAIITISVISFSLTFKDAIFERAALAYSQFEIFTHSNDTREIKNLKTSSVGFRLEQWKSALSLSKEAPLFGFGAGNAGKEVNRYVKSGKANKEIYSPMSEVNIGGLHSSYFESIVNEGYVGLILLLLFVSYPLFIFLKYRKYNYLISSLGVVFSINYMVFGISENPFVHDNFSSVYLVFLAILFSGMIREKYRPRQADGES